MARMVGSHERSKAGQDETFSNSGNLLFLILLFSHFYLNFKENEINLTYRIGVWGEGVGVMNYL